MTLNEITVMLATKEGKQFDEPYKLMLADKVNYWRARLVKNSIEKNQRERKFFKQDLYLPMEYRDLIPDCVGGGDCDISYTVSEIPRPLRANDMLFDFVGSIDGGTAFKESQVGLTYFLKKGKYSKNTIHFEYQFNKIKVYTKIPAILVSGIFDNPEQADKFSCLPGETSCNFWDKEYPVSNDVLQLIIQSILTVEGNRDANTENKQITVANETGK